MSSSWLARLWGRATGRKAQLEPGRQDTTHKRGYKTPDSPSPDSGTGVGVSSLTGVGEKCLNVWLYLMVPFSISQSLKSLNISA